MAPLTTLRRALASYAPGGKGQRRCPCSFARAIQQPALELWRGDDRQVAAAQAVLAHRAQCNRAARRGDYLAAMEQAL